ASAKLIADTFDVLSVHMWVRDEQSGRLRLASSSAQAARTDGGAQSESDTVGPGLHTKTAPFDLDAIDEPWAEELRQRNPAAFPEGGCRLCVPMHAGDQTLGAIVLADRIGAAAYTSEELELLKCIGDQITSVLVSFRLSSEVARARELEAFRTMSAFFVHDLKNAAASLNLTLKNLPVHFDDPAFRADALRGIGNPARRIDDIIARLSAVRERPALTLLPADLNQIVNEALDGISGSPDVELVKDLRPVPSIL